MKNNLKKPCAECPFKKDSIKGWLGGETAKSTFEMVTHECDFACHMTRHKKQEEMSRCRGFLMFSRKIGKMPKYNIPLANALKEIPFKEAMENESILELKEFFTHHTL